MTRVESSLKKNIRSYGHALNGLAFVFRSENNMIYHSIAAVVATIMGVMLNISRGEWIAVFLCCGLVLMAEMFNTVVEKLLDLLIPHYDIRVGQIKDIAAAAVLTISISALLVGIVIFLPKVIILFGYD